MSTSNVSVYPVKWWISFWSNDLWSPEWEILYFPIGILFGTYHLISASLSAKIKFVLNHSYLILKKSKLE